MNGDQLRAIREREHDRDSTVEDCRDLRSEVERLQAGQELLRRIHQEFSDGHVFDETWQQLHSFIKGAGQ